MNHQSNASPPKSVSVVFISVRDFARAPVAEQAQLQDALDEVVAQAIAAVADDARVVLDVRDGVAIVVPAHPQAALEAAQRAQAGAGELPFCIGLNHGPVKATAGDDGEAVLVGDGLLTASIVANFAAPGRLLASRSFCDALAVADPQLARGLRSAGLFTDTQVRTHELFALDSQAASRHRRKLITLGTLGVATILVLGVAGRMVRAGIWRSSRSAVIVFDIHPQGDVFVDGVLRGQSPPLMQLEVTAGSHLLELRHEAFAPHNLSVDLAPGDRLTVAHKFVAPKAPSFWRELRRKFGQ
jgi:class 3 adenylate cyclase